MKPKTALLIGWVIWALAVVGIVAWSARSTAQSPDDIPIAGFACQNGICVTTEAQLDNMMRLWYAMQQRVIKCRPPGKGET